MTKTTRSKARINYGVLSSTSEKVEKIFQKSHDDFDDQSVTELSTLFSGNCSEFKMEDKKNIYSYQLKNHQSLMTSMILSTKIQLKIHVTQLKILMKSTARLRS